MKKWIAGILALFVVLMAPTRVNGNSGPVVWEVGPSYELKPQENTHIAVKSEKLEFFIQGLEGYNLAGKGEVTY